MKRRLFAGISFLFTAPITGAAIVFAIVNRQPVAVDLWPFGIVVQMPVFALSLGTLGLGMLFGAGALWFPLFAARRRAQKAERKLLQTSAELNLAQERGKAEAGLAAQATPTLPAR